MTKATLLSLDDALLDLIISTLACCCHLEGAVRSTCLINKRFAALVKQPLAAWQSVAIDVSPERSFFEGCARRLSVEAAAYLARWLASVAPGVRKLSLTVRTAGRPPWELALRPFLTLAKDLKSLELYKVDLQPADLAVLGRLSSLKSLSCGCCLAEGTQPLSSLASLSQLCMLDLTVHNAPKGQELPCGLSTLSGLEALSLTANGGMFSSPRHLRLPWAWCQDLAQVTSLNLDGVDLPRLDQHNSSSSSSAAGSRHIFPILQKLELTNSTDRLAHVAIGCCPALESLTVENASLSTADWAALSTATQLHTLMLAGCSMDEISESETQVLPQLSFSTTLASLHLYGCPLHPAITQLPELREVELHWLEGNGEGLPGGPWLNNLCDLHIMDANLSSIEAVLRQATQLYRLRIEQCPYLQFRRHELPLLLELPLR